VYRSNHRSAIGTMLLVMIFWECFSCREGLGLTIDIQPIRYFGVRGRFDILTDTFDMHKVGYHAITLEFLVRRQPTKKPTKLLT